MWIFELFKSVWGAIRGARAKQAAADVPRGAELDRQIERDARELEERARVR